MAAAAQNPQSLGLAQAIANGGSAGAQAFKQAQSDLAGQKNASVDSAASRAGLIGAPTDFLKQQAAQISAPFDQASSAASSASNALGAYTGALGGAHSNYLSELAAAKPILQAELDKGAQGANISQLLQLANFKNSQEDRAYTKQQRDTTLTKQNQALDDAKVQQDALNKIVSHPDKNLGTFTQNVIASAKSLPEALAYLNSDQGQKDRQKKGIKDDTEMRSLLTQYFDPTTFKSLPALQTPAAQPAAAAPTPQAKSSGAGSPTDWLSNLSNALRGNGGRLF